MAKFIGNKKFYRMLLIIVLPIVLQQLIAQFVNLLDNIMIGMVDNSEMTGVALANQIIFIFNLCIFGSLSGASIFGSQFYGAKNKEGFQESFRFKWLMGLVIITIFTTVILLFNEPILNLFINSKEGELSNPAVVLASGKKYILIMLIGNVFFMIKEIYATSLREMKETLFPMICGVIAILINLTFNYLLIFGNFGFPKLGIVGAAIATVLSRIVEMIIIIVYTTLKRQKYPFIIGVYKKFIRIKSVGTFLPKTLLLLSNEFFWSFGLTMILSCYSMRGLDVVSSINIGNAVSNVFIIIGSSLGNAAGIILGNYLGSGKVTEAKDASYKILAFSFFAAIFFSIVMIVASYFIPDLYNTSEGIKTLARKFILISAIFLPFHAFNTCCYFTLRAGGKVFLTIIFDSLFVWVIRLPLAYILVKFTGLSIMWVYALAEGSDLLKIFIGYYLVDKGVWLKVIV